MLKPAKLFEIRLCGFQTVLHGTLGVPWSFSGDCVRCEGFLDRGVPGALNFQPSSTSIHFVSWAFTPNFS